MSSPFSSQEKGRIKCREIYVSTRFHPGTTTEDFERKFRHLFPNSLYLHNFMVFESVTGRQNIWRFAFFDARHVHAASHVHLSTMQVRVMLTIQVWTRRNLFTGRRTSSSFGTTYGGLYPNLYSLLSFDFVSSLMFSVCVFTSRNYNYFLFESSLTGYGRSSTGEVLKKINTEGTSAETNVDRMIGELLTFY